MKQNIAWEDFISLDYNQVTKLQKLIGQEYHIIESEEQWNEIKNYKHIFADDIESNIHTSYLGFLERINIGKMIEIIDGYLGKENLLGYFSFISYFSNGSDSHYKCLDEKSDELCDALWSTVKSILSSEVES